MEEEHVQFSRLSGDNNLPLSAKIRESGPEFQQEAGQLSFQGKFQLLFLVVVRQGNEAEVVGVFGDCLGKFALGGRKLFAEVGDGTAGRMVEVGLDTVH